MTTPEAWASLKEVVGRMDFGERNRDEATQEIGRSILEVRPIRQGRMLRVVFKNEEGRNRFKQRLEASGLQLATPNIQRMKVWVHDVPASCTAAQIREMVDASLASIGEPAAAVGEISLNEQDGKFLHGYALTSQREYRKALLFVSKRIRWALHNKAHDRLWDGAGGFGMSMRVEDASAPPLCMRCSQHGHLQFQCRRPAPCCLYCHEAHEPRACPIAADPSKHRCGACGQNGHNARQSAQCTVGRRATDRAVDAINQFLAGPAPHAQA
jgi:hypothetical protein